MPGGLIIMVAVFAALVVGSWVGYLLSGRGHREELRSERRARNVRESLARPGASGVTRRGAAIGSQPPVSEDDTYR
jgi:hypothetical protein